MKTKKAMKKITHIGMAALVAMGMLGTSCNKAESPEIETPETQKENIVTLTTTVGFTADGTKALTGSGVKTFAEGETMAIYYWKNKGNDHEKAVSAPLTAGDITNGGKSATFTFTLDNPYKDQSVVYIYPAAMANADFTPNYDALYNNQDGTLANLASNFDFCTKSGAWDGDNLPTLTLENQLAILAVTLKNEAGTSDITSSTTKLTVSDGTNTYNVNRSVAEGPIYVAIRPTSDATIDITATSDSKSYYKILTTPKSYAAGNGYPVSWKMTQGANLSKLTAAYTAQNGDKLTGTLANNVKISIADGATVTLDGVSINATGTWDSGNYAGITCLGDATIILSGTNTVKGFNEKYPGIQAAAGKTLTINGTGSLTASSNGYSAGIGGGSGVACGNIEIQGGTITATGGERGAGIGGAYNASCGNITISGGTVKATGGEHGAGIGGGRRFTANVSCGNILISGGTITAKGGEDAAGIGGGRGYNVYYQSSCGTITITSGVTEVTATKGEYATNSIGAGSVGICGTVTIEAGANVTQN